GEHQPPPRHPGDVAEAGHPRRLRAAPRPQGARRADGPGDPGRGLPPRRGRDRLRRLRLRIRLAAAAPVVGCPEQELTTERKQPMFPEPSPIATVLRERLAAFMDEHIYPNEQTYHEQIATGDRWQIPVLMESLKAKAKAASLWNLFLPDSEHGVGLT